MIRIVKERNAACEFEVDDVALVSEVGHYCVKGLEVPYIYGRLGEGLKKEETRKIVKTLIHRALRNDAGNY